MKYLFRKLREHFLSNGVFCSDEKYVYQQALLDISDYAMFKLLRGRAQDECIACTHKSG